MKRKASTAPAASDMVGVPGPEKVSRDLATIDSTIAETIVADIRSCFENGIVPMPHALSREELEKLDRGRLLLAWKPNGLHCFMYVAHHGTYRVVAGSWQISRHGTGLYDGKQKPTSRPTILDDGKPRPTILDGEWVAGDRYVPCDLLMLDGKKLCDVPYEMRLKNLATVLTAMGQGAHAPLRKSILLATDTGKLRTMHSKLDAKKRTIAFGKDAPTVEIDGLMLMDAKANTSFRGNGAFLFKSKWDHTIDYRLCPIGVAYELRVASGADREVAVTGIAPFVLPFSQVRDSHGAQLVDAAKLAGEPIAELSVAHEPYALVKFRTDKKRPNHERVVRDTLRAVREQLTPDKVFHFLCNDATVEPTADVPKVTVEPITDVPTAMVRRWSETPDSELELRIRGRRGTKPTIHETEFKNLLATLPTSTTLSWFKVQGDHMAKLPEYPLIFAAQDEVLAKAMGYSGSLCEAARAVDTWNGAMAKAGGRVTADDPRLLKLRAEIDAVDAKLLACCKEPHNLLAIAIVKAAELRRAHEAQRTERKQHIRTVTETVYREKSASGQPTANGTWRISETAPQLATFKSRILDYDFVVGEHMVRLDFKEERTVPMEKAPSNLTDTATFERTVRIKNGCVYVSDTQPRLLMSFYAVRHGASVNDAAKGEHTYEIEFELHGGDRQLVANNHDLIGNVMRNLRELPL